MQHVYIIFSIYVCLHFSLVVSVASWKPTVETVTLRRGE